MKTLLTAILLTAALVIAAPVLAAKTTETIGEHCINDANFDSWMIASDGRPIIIYACEIRGVVIRIAIAPQVITDGASDIDSKNFADDRPLYKGGRTSEPLYHPNQLRELIPEGTSTETAAAGPAVKYLVDIETCFYWGTNPNEKGELEHFEQGSPFIVPLVEEEKF